MRLEELARYGLLGALFGDQQPAGEIEGYPGATDRGQHDEDDPHDCHVHAEITGEAGSDSREHPILDGAAQRLRQGMVV
jgi:hypothetical protein